MALCESAEAGAWHYARDTGAFGNFAAVGSKPAPKALQPSPYRSCTEPSGLGRKAVCEHCPMAASCRSHCPSEVPIALRHA